jgi:hypothetical protein
MRAYILGMGRSLVVPLILLAATFLPPPPPARADGGFRCATGRVVRNGETEDDVASKCGDPDAVNSWSEVRTEAVWENGRKVERSVTVTYDEWKYDLGRHRLIRYVTFAQGRLVSVRTGSYGQ